MPVGAYEPVSFVPNGVTTVFPYNFRILNAAHLKITIDDAEVTSGYTVDGVGASNGGNVTFTSAPTGSVGLIERDVPFVRTEDYQPNGDWKESTVDADFDLRTMQIQQLKALVDRVPKLPTGSGLAGDDFALPEPGAGMALRWNAAGTALETFSYDVLGTTFTQSGAGAVARTWTSKVGETVSVKDFGATGNGATNDLAAFNAAIVALGVGGTIYVPKGNYYLSAPLTLPVGLKYLRIRGDGGNSDVAVSTFFCKDLSDYVFTWSGVDKELALEYLAFDGFNGGLTPSTTWRGVAKFAAMIHRVTVRNVRAFGSHAAFPMWDLAAVIFASFEDCMFSNWEKHIGAAVGSNTTTATTVSFRKVYFTYMRQCVQVLSTLECHFDDCIFESSVVAYAAFLSEVLFTDPHFENIGYDNSVTGLVDGITERSFGIVDAPLITGNVTSAITQRYGTTTIIGGRLYSRVGGATAPWIDGIGKGSASGGGGSLNLINTVIANQTLFVTDATNRSSFEYHAQLPFQTIPIADARQLTTGYGNVFGGVNQATIRDGVFHVTAAAGLTAPPATGGPFAVGDTATRTVATQAAGKERSWICTVAGSPGTWDTLDFIPVSKRGSPAAASVIEASGVLENTGDVHVWEIVGNDVAADGVIAYHARAVVSKLVSANDIDVTEDVDTGSSAVTLSVTTDTYTIRVTNNNAGQWRYSMRLVAVYRTHV